MCGIIAILSKSANINVYEGLQALQHRGQDSCGIANETTCIKYPGLVKNAFTSKDILKLNSNLAIGHVRYATNNLKDYSQPLSYKIKDRNIYLCHNGNIINTTLLRNILITTYNVDLAKEVSDSELLLILFGEKLKELNKNKEFIFDNTIKYIFEFLSQLIDGSYSLSIIIEGYGIIIHRDCKGIRPLIWGSKQNNHVIASESSSLSLLNFPIKRDVLPGETIIFKQNKEPIHYQTHSNTLSPCLFEYIYFSRQDSTIDQINVTKARLAIGSLLGEKILKQNLDIDIIIPVPDTSMTFALGIQSILKIPIGEGFIKNRYVDRTFIMQNHDIIRTNIKRKLSPNPFIIKDKNILIIDDSIVRGNTSKHIVEQSKNCGAKKIYFGSCAPIISNINNYGIFIPTKTELISYKKTINDMEKILNVDKLIFNDLHLIVELLKNFNFNIKNFETSMFQ